MNPRSDCEMTVVCGAYSSVQCVACSRVYTELTSRVTGSNYRDAALLCIGCDPSAEKQVPVTLRRYVVTGRNVAGERAMGVYYALSKKDLSRKVGYDFRSGFKSREAGCVRVDQ